MPDRFVQSSDGTVLSFDIKKGLPVNIRKWTDEPIGLEKLSKDQLLEIIAGLANGNVRGIEKAK